MGNSHTLLLVEPDEDSRTLYTESLRAAGFEVVTASRSDSAWQRVVDADLVVTGTRIPGAFDAHELIRRTRENYPAKRIIVLSACSVPECRRRAEAAGCDAFLLKPCLPDVLLAEIARVLDDRSRRTRKCSVAGEHRRTPLPSRVRKGADKIA